MKQEEMKDNIENENFKATNQQHVTHGTISDLSLGYLPVDSLESTWNSGCTCIEQLYSPSDHSHRCYMKTHQTLHCVSPESQLVTQLCCYLSQSWQCRRGVNTPLLDFRFIWCTCTHFGVLEFKNPSGSSGTIQIYVIHLYKCLWKVIQYANESFSHN